MLKSWLSKEGNHFLAVIAIPKLVKNTTMPLHKPCGRREIGTSTFKVVFPLFFKFDNIFFTKKFFLLEMCSRPVQTNPPMHMQIQTRENRAMQTATSGCHISTVNDYEMSFSGKYITAAEHLESQVVAVRKCYNFCLGVLLNFFLSFSKGC